MTETQQPDLHQLSDIEVLTVGLVTHGANQEDFFLRKEATMPNEELQLEGEQEQMPGWVAKLRAWWKGDLEEALLEKGMSPKGKKALGRACKAMAEAEGELTPGLRKALEEMRKLADMMDEEECPPVKKEATEEAAKADAKKGELPPWLKKPGKDGEDKEDKAEGEDKEEGYGYPEPKTKAKKLAKEEGTVEKEEKVEKKEPEIPPAVAEQLAVLEKSRQELMAELEKSREAQFKSTYLAKAQEVVAIPVPPTELAEQLMFVAKQDPARAEWWLTMLKSVSRQLSDAGIFNEKGLSGGPEETNLMAEVTKSGNDLRETLLHMPAEHASAYLQERRHSIMTGR